MSESKVPEDRRYTAEHEWVREVDGELEVGITDHAQGELTDIVFVDLPPVGKAVTPGTSVLVLESVKTVADIYAPAEGSVTRVNEDLKKHPEWMNQDPYGKGWVYRMKASGPVRALLGAAEYRALLAKGAPSH
jgi:glycine cleavage system H protein